jgi:multidrug efflux pump subunit AcrA (membrane-fusion protein)
MQAITQVNEVDISKIKKSQKTRIKLDAFPERQFSGTVVSVATIGQTRDRTSTVKKFEVIIDIDGTDPILKPGMTTSNEIIMEAIPNVVYVPIESVFEQKGKTIVYRMNGSSADECEVKTGAKNSNYVVILEGLKEGEPVALRNPKEKMEEMLPKEKPTQKTS